MFISGSKGREAIKDVAGEPPADYFMYSRGYAKDGLLSVLEIVKA